MRRIAPTENDSRDEDAVQNIETSGHADIYTEIDRLI